jgi:hypothetical protein
MAWEARFIFSDRYFSIVRNGCKSFHLDFDPRAGASDRKAALLSSRGWNSPPLAISKQLNAAPLNPKGGNRRRSKKAPFGGGHL